MGICISMLHFRNASELKQRWRIYEKTNPESLDEKGDGAYFKDL